MQASIPYSPFNAIGLPNSNTHRPHPCSVITCHLDRLLAESLLDKHDIHCDSRVMILPLVL
jgi:hypothetical protein